MTNYEIPEGARQGVARLLMLSIAATNDARARSDALWRFVREVCPEAFAGGDDLTLEVDNGRLFVVPDGEMARQLAELAVAAPEPKQAPAIDIDGVIAQLLRECLAALKERPAEAHLSLDRLAKRMVWAAVPLARLQDAVLLEGLATEVGGALEGEGDKTARARVLVERYFLGTAERLRAAPSWGALIDEPAAPTDGVGPWRSNHVAIGLVLDSSMGAALVDEPAAPTEG